MNIFGQYVIPENREQCKEDQSAGDSMKTQYQESHGYLHALCKALAQRDGESAHPGVNRRRCTHQQNNGKNKKQEYYRQKPSVFFK